MRLTADAPNSYTNTDTTRISCTLTVCSCHLPSCYTIQTYTTPTIKSDQPLLPSLFLSLLLPSHLRQSEHRTHRPPPRLLFEVELAIRTTAQPSRPAPTSTSYRRFHVKPEVSGGTSIPFFLSVVPHTNVCPLSFHISVLLRSVTSLSSDMPSCLAAPAITFTSNNTSLDSGNSRVSSSLCRRTVRVTLYTRLHVSQALATSPDFHIKPEVPGGMSIPSFSFVLLPSNTCPLLFHVSVLCVFRFLMVFHELVLTQLDV